jgi:lysophospholipase L1-like esterase
MTRLLTRAALIALGLFMGLAFAEIWLRLRPEPSGFEDDRPRYLAGPPRISPFRERPELPAKRPGVFRILALGDSFTWGANVQMNYTYPKLLEWMLNEGGERRYEVYNFGVNGAGTADELDLLEKLAVHEPDLVLIGYFLNDPAKDSELAEDAPRPSWVRARSRLFDWIHRRLWSRRLVAGQVTYLHELYRPESATWKAQRETVSRLARRAQQLEIPLRVVLWPHLAFPMDERYPFRDIHARIRALFAESHVATLDLLESLKGVDNDRLQAVPRYDSHPSEIAHRMAAEAIRDWIGDIEPVPQQTQPSEVPAEKKSADFRILSLGRFVEAEGSVLSPQTYPRHVEWLIQTVCRDGAEVQAVRTEDVVGELERGLRERPNLVVVEEPEQQALERLAVVERESGIRTLVLRWPDVDSLLKESRRRPAVPVLDLRDAFRGRDPRRLEAAPGPTFRPNEIAHRMAGEAVFDWLRENEPWVATRVVEPRLHPNPPHWRRWRDLDFGRR